MMVMCGQSNQVWHYWAGKYPGKVGHLFGPKNMAKQTLRKWMPFACDNDAFIAWTNKTPWSESAWIEMLQRVRLFRLEPLWILVPDKVADRDATLDLWKRYSPEVDKFGWKKAIAVQDGMTPDDVPDAADVVFVGGSTEFKWRTVETWTRSFPRVHVGRVNNIARVEQCEDLGVESVDGTGWFQDPTRQDKLIALEHWMSGQRSPKTEEIVFV